jgi:GNAT superfamily N-acetyltransferase
MQAEQAVYLHAHMHLRKAFIADLPSIWEILQQAIEQRRLDGSDQWQDGYPNEQTVTGDINNGNAYVLIEEQNHIAYAAIIFEVEPAYTEIQGKWLTNEKYAVVHRVATANAYKGKGVATRLFTLIETLCLEKNIYSIKVDTNFDNVAMLKILDRLGYIYCGEVFFRGSPRKAFEKVLCVTDTINKL